jgi:hypothetical protein
VNVPIKVYQSGDEATGVLEDAPNFAVELTALLGARAVQPSQIVTTCFAGRRGNMAAAEVSKLGHSVCNLAGGLGAIEADSLGPVTGPVAKPYMKSGC